MGLHPEASGTRTLHSVPQVTFVRLSTGGIITAPPMDVCASCTLADGQCPPAHHRAHTVLIISGVPDELCGQIAASQSECAAESHKRSRQGIIPLLHI